MGAKQGKHSRGEFDGESSPKKQAKRSSKRGSKSETPSRESSPLAGPAEGGSIPTLEREPGPGYHPETPRKKGSPSKSKKPGSPSKTSKSGTKSPTKSTGKSPKREQQASKGSPRTPAKETTFEVETVGELRTPAKQEQGEQQMVEQEPLTPLSISVTNHQPQATSTPAAPNGVISTGMESPPLSPDGDTTDQSDDEAFTPNDQQYRNGHRSPSPTSSMVSASTISTYRHRSDSSSLGRRSEPNFGRFYNTSYLEPGKSSYLQKSSSISSTNNKKSPHFHRPANFTFSNDTPEFLKSRKGSGMMAITQQRKVKVRRSSSPVGIRNTEAVRLSTFPAGKPPPPNEPVKIERDDWPGPACPAAVLPEILRERRRSRGEKDEDEDEEEMQDPLLLKELESMEKLKDKSGIGSVIYHELEQRKLHPKTHLDPWKASRAPSAKYEPRYRTRYQSPMFASPSRFVDRPRRYWDDSDIRGYRSLSTLANMPVPKPGYGPTYGMTPRAATLPLSGIFGARDFRYFDFGESSQVHDDDPERQRSRHTSSSTLTERDGAGGRSRGSSIFDGPGTISLLKLQKSSWHTEAEPPVYSYDTLRITNFNLPKDVDRNALEIHLNDGEFQDIFNMPREQFYRLAEWKRNDIKRKHDLY